ncbi:MAG: hypothetical protein UV20_C0004G0128 [Candidatus Magasanikbacteria bacterium GW2011_GWA2_42_32]|uniref:Uncharacterized protein n=1 Tax=Candidatus Magasanikbacteria bacterium GW2011_GWA2_42_32 TaxID=1619039 RepID=A0A0G1A7K0_9BACT|nr:MAG: hypothetical protein UV20_C0004G0128 [Candidatus Magasanikbacteria bacterium GW2011_GWA2_42_32]OGH85856.1 MAG: hypothetical protein A2294_04025 [Candidatus Magasanikbacteria bacterium RIFOXYB2_FULL_38_10]
MINTYADLIEDIITEMKMNLPKEEHLLVGHEYFVWLDFLKKIKPESKLLICTNGTIKEYTEIGEIMILAETNKYPVWHIQPHFIELEIVITYEDGELKTVNSKDNINMSEVWDVPRHLDEFSGTVKGILNEQKNFIAYDLELVGNFLQKMELLKNAGFTISEYVLFPTDKIASTSSSKLEASLLNFISKSCEAGLKVDGVVVVSDNPLLPGNCTRLIFKPKSVNN